MLTKLDLLPVYDSSAHDLIRELIVPLLSESTIYLRGVGFFTSRWLRLPSKRMVELIENGGQAQVVLSLCLEAADWEAFRLGEQARHDEYLKQTLDKKITEL